LLRFARNDDRELKASIEEGEMKRFNLWAGCQPSGAGAVLMMALGIAGSSPIKSSAAPRIRSHRESGERLGDLARR